MTPKKQPTTNDGTTSKDKSTATAGSITPSSSLDLNPIVEEIVYTPSQEATGDIHPPSTYEAQLLQMFADMREEMVKQQTLFDCEREQAAHDRENEDMNGRS